VVVVFTGGDGDGGGKNCNDGGRESRGSLGILVMVMDDSRLLTADTFAVGT